MAKGEFFNHRCPQMNTDKHRWGYLFLLEVFIEPQRREGHEGREE